MNILLTNDDGVFAPGLSALRGALSELGTVTVVAPKTEQSGVGHAITYRKSITAEQVRLSDSTEAFAITGTPVDCVKFGLLEVFRGAPELVVSGINLGLNLGDNIFYSGTVAAALEGAMYGITSLAVSTSKHNEHQLDRVAEQAIRVLRTVLSTGSQAVVAFNVNVPALSEAQPEIMFTHHRAAPFPERYLLQERDGEVTYLLELRQGIEEPELEISDVYAVRAGRISVTPLRTCLTCYDWLALHQSAHKAGTVDIGGGK